VEATNIDKRETPSGTRKALARRAIFFVAGTAIVYGVVVGLIAPPIAKKVIASKLSEALGRKVEVDGLSVNPYTLAATVDGVRILEADGKTSFVAFDRLDADASITSLTRFAPVVDEMTLNGLKVRLVRDGENHYNASDILARLAARPKEKAEEPARFSVSNIRIANARIDFDDQPLGSKHQVTDLDIDIPFISNLPRHLKQFVQPRLSAHVNGAPLVIKGETLPFENSLRTHVALQLEGFDLPRYMGYSPAPLPVKLQAGKLDGRIQVRFTQATAKDATIDVSGNVAVNDLSVAGAEGPLGRAGKVEARIASFDPLGGKGVIDSVRVTDAQVGEPWRVASAEAAGIKVSLHERDVHVDSVATRGGNLALARKADGSIEMPVALPQSQSQPQSQPAAEPAPPWKVAIDKATIDEYQLAVTDASVKPAARHHVTIAHAEARDLSTEKGSKSTVLARLGVDRGGSVDVESTVVMDPLLVDAKVDAKRIDLVPLRPYVQYFQTVKVKSALASAKGHLQLRGSGKDMKVAYAGSAELSKVASLDTVSNEDLLNWDSVVASQVAFKWGHTDPVEVAVGDIAVNKLYSRVVVTPEGKINLQTLKLATENDPAPEPQPKEELKPRNVRIDRISFNDSRLNFTDHFIRPNYTADVGELNGTVTGLSSEPSARGVVDLKGSYDKSSPVVIAGTINPLSGDLFLDIAAKGKDIDLPRLSAYSLRYAGYPITAGKLTLDVKYHVEDGKLDGRNNIVLDQLTFGDKVESPEATTLPVLFAVNLLKDANGRINLELPIKGSLEDPQFDMGALIGQVVSNLLKKALTSPFQLLAAALGGDGGSKGSGSGSGAGAGDDMAFVAFAPGAGEGTAADRAKLDRITKALLDRPAVRIEMAAHVDRDKDLAALKRAALRAKLRESKGGEVTEAEYPALVKAAYEKEFGKPKEKEEPPSPAQMEAKLMEKVQVGDEALQALAARRADWVKGYLTAQGRLPAERVMVAAAGAGDAQTRVSRVDFTLK
jgi:uncharacterized protein involved in outer membrane biogenesis